MTEFTDFIVNFGFPMACCFAMAKYILKKDSNMHDEFKEMIKNYQIMNESCIKALENNTNALNNLKESIEREVKDDN